MRKPPPYSSQLHVSLNYLYKTISRVVCDVIAKATTYCFSMTTATSSTLAVTIIVTLLSSVMLIGCNNANVTQLIDIVTNQEETDDTQIQFCQAHTMPFVHSLCSVSQSKLIEQDSTLSLQLFWKDTHTTAINNHDNDSSENSETAAEASTQPEVNAEAITPFYTFENLLTALPNNRNLKFAMNAGMYNSEFAPIGYTIMQGEQVLSMNLNKGGGNFHLLPNGVLWWDKLGNVSITESNELAAMLADGVAQPWYATQSGPMLVINGEIHPKFNKDSDSTKFRNGVGVCDDGNIKFVNSDVPINFYQFASLFKNDLDCPNALFLDGGIASALYAPELGRSDAKNMGVMVGLVEEATSQAAKK